MLRQLCLILLAAIFLAGPCEAEPLLKVGYVKSPEYFTQDANGDYSGAIYENIEKAMAYTEYNTSYHEIAPGDAERALAEALMSVVNIILCFC